MIDADNFASKTEYDGEGNPVKTTDGNTHVRTLIRDVAGQVLSATDAEGNSTTYTYNQNGNVKTVIDALGTETVTNYDYEDRPTTITEASNTSEERTKAILNRDKMGNPLQIQDYNGNVSTTEYNALYLPAKVFDPSPFSANYTETTCPISRPLDPCKKHNVGSEKRHNDHQNATLEENC
jgi:YD repeat-containing protein